MQEPLQNLQESIKQLTVTVFSLIEESHDLDYHINQDVAYAAPVCTVQQGFQ
jgi:hypothetical protein